MVFVWICPVNDLQIITTSLLNYETRQSNKTGTQDNTLEMQWMRWIVLNQYNEDRRESEKKIELYDNEEIPISK